MNVPWNQIKTQAGLLAKSARSRAEALPKQIIQTGLSNWKYGVGGAAAGLGSGYWMSGRSDTKFQRHSRALALGVGGAVAGMAGASLAKTAYAGGRGAFHMTADKVRSYQANRAGVKNTLNQVLNGNTPKVRGLLPAGPSFYVMPGGAAIRNTGSGIV